MTFIAILTLISLLQMKIYLRILFFISNLTSRTFKVQTNLLIYFMNWLKVIALNVKRCAILQLCIGSSSRCIEIYVPCCKVTQTFRSLNLIGQRSFEFFIAGGTIFSWNSLSLLISIKMIQINFWKLTKNLKVGKSKLLKIRKSQY